MAGAQWLTSTRADGDFRIDAPVDGLEACRRALVDLPWVWLRQVHGAAVHVVNAPGSVARIAGQEGDALVTTSGGVVLAVQTADCGPIVLHSAEGVLGIAHAGWRGLVAGVVEATIDTMRAYGATTVTATLGPCIGPECYEFGAADLDVAARRFGSGVRAHSAAGNPALDLRAAATRAAADRDVVLEVIDGCPACDPAGRYFSYRARQDRGRMATVVWRDA